MRIVGSGDAGAAGGAGAGAAVGPYPEIRPVRVDAVWLLAALHLDIAPSEGLAVLV